MSRLTIEITGEQHQQIKALAALRGKSIKDYVIEKLFPAQKIDEEEQAWEELKALLNQRITEAENGAISKKTFRQVAEETLQKLGKA